MPSLLSGPSATGSPSHEDWLSRQSLIKQLYLDENRTLKQVMETMRRKHRFIASYAVLHSKPWSALTCHRVKMYKSRITKWGFDQKYKKRNGHPSTPNENTREHRHNGVSPAVLSDSPTQSVDADSSIGRSSTKCVGWSLEDLAMTVRKTPRISGQLEHAIFRYFHSSFWSKLWVSDGEDTPCRSVQAPPQICDMISTFKHDLIAACSLIRQEGICFAFAYLHQGSDKVKDIVFAECPQVIADLIETSLWPIKEDRYDVVRVFLEQFADMSDVFNSESQAIYRILAQKSKSDKLAFEGTALNAWRCIVDCFCYELGSTHFTTMHCITRMLTYFAKTSFHVWLICPVPCNADHAEQAENLLRIHFKICDDVRGPTSTQSGTLLQALISVLLLQHSHAEAEELCNETISRAHQEDAMLFMALRGISDAQQAQKKFDRAEENLRKLVEISTRYWGRDSERTIYQMTNLKNCLTEQGNFQGAAKVRAEITEAALRIDIFSVFSTKSSTWPSDVAVTSSPAIEENIDHLRSSTKFSDPKSRCGYSLGRFYF
jgi:tetratricopeptide (TPR) repeat protein